MKGYNDQFAVPKTYVTGGGPPKGPNGKPVRKHVDSKAKQFAEIENDTDHFGDTRPKVGMAVGNRMKTLRSQKEWTQKDLALRCGVKIDVIKEYENGTAVPNPKLMKKFEQVLEGSIRE